MTKGSKSNAGFAVYKPSVRYILGQFQIVTLPTSISALSSACRKGKAFAKK